MVAMEIIATVHGDPMADGLRWSSSLLRPFSSSSSSRKSHQHCSRYTPAAADSCVDTDLSLLAVVAEME